MLEQAIGAGQERIFVRGLVSLWIFSAAVSALSLPNSKSSQLYIWVYKFSHLLAANLDRFWFSQDHP